MRSSLTLTACLAMLSGLILAPVASAQRAKTKPDPSQGASVSQTIGVNGKVTIVYHRPGVKGRNVWKDKSDNELIGALVPRDENPRAWRAGANEATTIEFSEDVKVEGKDLAAGKYALSMIPADDGWTIVFNTNAGQWGTFSTRKEDDALRVTVRPETAPHQEWLMFGFDEPGAYSCKAYLRWEKVKVVFAIETVAQ